MTKLVSAFILLTISSATAFAQSVSTGSSEFESPRSSTPWGISVDAGALLNKGFGIGFHRVLTQQLMGSAHYSQSVLESDDETDNTLQGYHAEHKGQEYGVRLDYFPLSTRPEGWYVGAEAVQVNLETEVDPIFSDNKRTLKDEVFGARGYSGYQFRVEQLITRLGVGYGTGGVYSNNLGGTEAEIKDGVLLDVALTFVF